MSAEVMTGVAVLIAKASDDAMAPRIAASCTVFKLGRGPARQATTRHVRPRFASSCRCADASLCRCVCTGSLDAPTLSDAAHTQTAARTTARSIARCVLRATAVWGRRWSLRAASRNSRILAPLSRHPTYALNKLNPFLSTNSSIRLTQRLLPLQQCGRCGRPTADGSA
eukprot:scaffold5390_cov116-Isochrysis_galbana.AAC.11